ncbi:hypothetical protein ABPG75_004558 [Micractinium tetrahymenae]
MRASSLEQPTAAAHPGAAAAMPAAAPLRRLPSGGCCPPPHQLSLDRAGSTCSSSAPHAQPAKGSSRRGSVAGAVPQLHQPSRSRASSAALPPHRWAQRHVRITHHKRPGFMCGLSAEARLPLPAAALFELLTHPQAEDVLRSLGRCTRRRVLSEEGARVVAVVEQETTCQFLWFSGRVRTPLRVEVDAAARSMAFHLAPASFQGGTDGGGGDDGGSSSCSGGSGNGGGGGGGEGLCGHLAAMEGSWTVTPAGERSCLLRVEQAVQPRGLPPLLGPAVRSYMAGQVRRNFEDLYVEALCIRAGSPTLRLACLAASPPASSVASATGAAPGADPASEHSGGNPARRPLLRACWKLPQQHGPKHQHDKRRQQQLCWR